MNQLGQNDRTFLMLEQVHPAYLAELLMQERASVSKISLMLMPQFLREEVRGYLEPATLAVIDSMNGPPNLFPVRAIFEGFIKGIGLPEDLENMPWFVRMPAMKLLGILENAGEKAISAVRVSGSARILGSEGIISGIAMLASVIYKQSERIRRFVLMKLPPELRTCLQRLIDMESEELRCIRSQSEGIFQGILEGH